MREGTHQNPHGPWRAARTAIASVNWMKNSKQKEGHPDTQQAKKSPSNDTSTQTRRRVTTKNLVEPCEKHRRSQCVPEPQNAQKCRRRADSDKLKSVSSLLSLYFKG